MAPCRRRYSARRFKALGHDPQLLVIRPAPPATSLDHLRPFKLSTALMAVHKDCYAPIGLIQQGGPRRRETVFLANNLSERAHSSHLNVEKSGRFFLVSCDAIAIGALTCRAGQLRRSLFS